MNNSDHADESDSLSENSSSSGSEDCGENLNIDKDTGIIQPYAFEPFEETDGEQDNEEDMRQESDTESDGPGRLEDTNW